MLSRENKKKYIEIMHEYSSIRSELEVFLNPESQVDDSDESRDEAETNISTSNIASPISNESDRLSQLRAELNI